MRPAALPLLLALLLQLPGRGGSLRLRPAAPPRGSRGAPRTRRAALQDVVDGEQAAGDEEAAPRGPGGAVPEMKKLPVVAVVGRPNVGKSTIVNRVCASHQRGAIVYDEIGVTRDRIYQSAFWGEHRFKVVDTGGLVFEEDEDHLFASEIRQQAMIAMDEASAILFVVDGRAGVTAMDESIARFLRSIPEGERPPVFVAVNKCEGGQSLGSAEFWKLGLGEPFPMSGIHGSGVAEALEAMCATFPAPPTDEELRLHAQKPVYRVALVGRPNVGKSSLLNRLLGRDRSIVSDVAGTTRDSIDAEVEHEGEIFTFVDTAGVRKRTKVEKGSEYLMVNRAFKAVRRADVVLLLIDATDGVRDQDRVLAQRIAEEGRACVVVVNKWDAVEKDDKTFNKALAYVRDNLPAVGRWAEPMFISALTGQRTGNVFATVKKAATEHRRRVPTATLNEVVRDAVMWQPPPKTKSKQGRIYYANQIGVAPPTVVLFVNDPRAFGDGYKRYLDRKVRESLGLRGTPIKWIWRGKRLRDMKTKGTFQSRKPHAG